MPDSVNMPTDFLGYLDASFTFAESSIINVNNLTYLIFVIKIY